MNKSILSKAIELTLLIVLTTLIGMLFPIIVSIAVSLTTEATMTSCVESVPFWIFTGLGWIYTGCLLTSKE